jgi:hypothetical protein
MAGGNRRPPAPCNCPVGATGSERSLGSGVAVFAREFEREVQLVSPPRWLQRSLFVVLAPVGRARGYNALDPRYQELARRMPAG